MDYFPKSTVISPEQVHFDTDVDNLREALKGDATGKQTIIGILTARTNLQRLVIDHLFLCEYGRTLSEELKGELSGQIKDLIIALMTPRYKYLCQHLYKVISGVGTNDMTLFEIFCNRFNEEISEIAGLYERLYGRPLTDHMCNVTYGPFRHLLQFIISGVRDEAGTIDEAKAKEQAGQMYNTEEATLCTDEEVLGRIFGYSSFAHLRLVFEEYKKLSGQTMQQAIKHGMYGEMQEIMMVVGELAYH